MLIPRPIACAAMAAATAVAVVLPAQAGSAATSSSLPVTASAAAPAAGRLSVLDAAGVDDSTDFDGSDDSASDGDDGSDDVQVVDGTDAPDDSDVLAGGSGSSASPAHRDRTSGRWARIAVPTGVRATLTGNSRATVSWRAGLGGVLAQRFVVELRAGGSALQTTTFSSARSAVLFGLAPAKQYSVKVTAVAADGTRKAAVGASIRTPAAVKPVRLVTSTKSAGKLAAAAKAAARHAKALSLR